VTICTADLAFVDLRPQRFQRSCTRNQEAEVCALRAAHVVKVQHDRICLTAVDARVAQQVPKYKTPVTLFVLILERLPRHFEHFRAVMIALFIMFMLTAFAIRPEAACLRIRFIKVDERF